MNQHSADFVDDHRISVFNNNAIAAPGSSTNAFVEPGGINQVMVYDFATASVSQPFAALLAQAKPQALSGGRARYLPDGGLFLEETTTGRHLRFTPQKLLWSRVNDYDTNHIGAVSWSRYLTAQEALPVIAALSQKKCSVP